MKSNTEAIRLDSIKLFSTCCNRNLESADLVHVIDLIFKTIISTTNIDSRLVLLYVISKVPPSNQVSQVILTQIYSLVVKETTVSVCNEYFIIFSKHFSHLVSNGTSEFIEKDLLTMFLNGLNEKKHHIRQGFIIALSDVQVSELYVSKLSKLVFSALEKACDAGISLIDPKKESPNIIEFYAGFMWILRTDFKEQGIFLLILDLINRRNKLVVGILCPTPSKSILLNQKYYSKLSNVELNTFANLICYLISSDNQFDSSIYATLVYLMIQTPPDIRKLLINCVSTLVKNDFNFSKRMFPSIITVIESIYLNEDSVENVKSSNHLGYKIFLLLQSFLPLDSPKDVITSILLNLIVSLNCKLVSSVISDAWIRFCFKSKIDPVELINENFFRLMNEWKSESGLLFKPGYSESLLYAISKFTAVSPNDVFIGFVPWMSDVIHDEKLVKISKSDLVIWKKPIEEIKQPAKLKDLVKKGPKTAPTKQEKLEKDLLIAQAEKEAKIKKTVEMFHCNLHLMIDIFNSIIAGFLKTLSPDASMTVKLFSNTLVENILALILREMSDKETGVVLAGKRAIDMFISLGKISVDAISSLSSVRPTLQMTILRSLGVVQDEVNGIPQVFCNIEISGPFLLI